MRRAARTDTNHTAVVEAFRMCGCSVLSLAQLAGGCPDLLVSLDRDTSLLVEVKDGTRPPSERRLTPDQRDFHEAWKGRICIVESATAALDLVALLRGRRRKAA